MMKYFPRGDKHYLKDNINHLVVRKELFKRFKSKGWTTRTTDDAEWISTDEGSQADEFVKQMHQASIDYPHLCESTYIAQEFAHAIDAVALKARQTGTIIKSESDTLEVLTTLGYEVRETSPNCFELMMSDDDFKTVTEKFRL